MVPEGIEKNYFLQHTECDYFPCHEGIPKERFNCMLCYCPLYTLGEDCGGNYTYTSKGAKNCKACNIPHDRDNGVRLVRSRFADLRKMAARKQPS